MPPPRQLPTVLLRHDDSTPDAPPHFDWLLSRCTLEDAHADPDARDAITLRLDTRPDHLSPGGTSPAQQLPDHRRHYLRQEGEVPPTTPGGIPRGRVERIAAGIWRPADEADPLSDFIVAFAGQPPARWSFKDGVLRRA